MRRRILRTPHPALILIERRSKRRQLPPRLRRPPRLSRPRDALRRTQSHQARIHHLTMDMHRFPPQQHPTKCTHPANLHPLSLETCHLPPQAQASLVCHPEGICCRRCLCRCLFSSTQPRTPGCPILSPPDRAMVGERTPSTRRPCLSPRPLRTSAPSASVVQSRPHKSPISTPQSHYPKLFFTLLLSKIACQAPKPHQKPITQSSSTR
jgi:hypothetical protein